MSWLRYMIVMWLEICCMMVRLCDMNTYVSLRLLCRLVSRLRICVWMEMLSVDMGLLVMMSCGVSVSV